MNLIEQAVSKFADTGAAPDETDVSARRSRLIEQAVDRIAQDDETARPVRHNVLDVQSRLDAVELDVVPGSEDDLAPQTDVAFQPLQAQTASEAAERAARREEPTVRTAPVARPAAARAARAEIKGKLVEIDLQALTKRGMIAPGQAKTPLGEEFRMIKRPLINGAFTDLGKGRPHRGNLIMITSAFPKEGKTFCAINLALSIAMEMDHTVLLVDADVARPSIPQRLGVKADLGLMDVLTDENIELGDVILRTNIPTLSILSSGRPHAHSTELLASEAMERMLVELSTRYNDRIVIFDSPPLLVTSEARTLAAKMGQLVMVVEADQTTHDSVLEAIAAVSACPVIGMVLNKSTFAHPGESYGYYGQ